MGKFEADALLGANNYETFRAEKTALAAVSRDIDISVRSRAGDMVGGCRAGGLAGWRAC